MVGFLVFLLAIVANSLYVGTYVELDPWLIGDFAPPREVSVSDGRNFFFILLTGNTHMEDFGASRHASERIGNFRYQAPRYQCISSITERVSRLGVEPPGACFYGGAN